MHATDRNPTSQVGFSDLDPEWFRRPRDPFATCQHSAMRPSFIRSREWTSSARARSRTAHRAQHRRVRVRRSRTAGPCSRCTARPSCGAGLRLDRRRRRANVGLRVIAPDRPGHRPLGSASACARSPSTQAEIGALADALGVDRFARARLLGRRTVRARRRARRCRSACALAAIVAGAGEIGSVGYVERPVAQRPPAHVAVAAHAARRARRAPSSPTSAARAAPRVALWSAAAEMTEPDRGCSTASAPPRRSRCSPRRSPSSSAGAVADYALLARGRGTCRSSEITVPVHCWHGTADTLVPLAHTEALVERLPDARLTTWPGKVTSR